MMLSAVIWPWYLQGKTALMYSVREQTHVVIQLLLAGADITIKDQRVRTLQIPLFQLHVNLVLQY